ncbi:DUF5779 family protein [Natronoarchaeum mannanilyticum]|uniref:DUF5779 family protein n=1 Tax=Natronoarchaeum mannanilyticum TaxID=926360 RepID=A0AAV3TAR5_9EURY
MTDFSLDLGAVEDQIEEDDDEALESEVVLGVLDGTTDPDEWTETVLGGNVLVLAVEGEINDLAAGFAREIRDGGGELVHFRGFLVVSPPGVSIDTDRL